MSSFFLSKTVALEKDVPWHWNISGWKKFDSWKQIENKLFTAHSFSFLCSWMYHRKWGCLSWLYFNHGKWKVVSKLEFAKTTYSEFWIYSRKVCSLQHLRSVCYRFDMHIRCKILKERPNAIFSLFVMRSNYTPNKILKFLIYRIKCYIHYSLFFWKWLII